ncbi:MAG: VCBS repeat-containing protein, partial [Phycisphaerae bacterium]
MKRLAPIRTPLAVLIVAIGGCDALPGGTTGLVQTFPRTIAWQPITIGVGGNALPTAITVADVNVDGLPDVIVGYPGTDAAGPAITIFFQVTPTQWQPVQIISGPAATGVQAVAAADISGDGRPDIIAAGNGQILYLRSGENPLNAIEWSADVIAQSAGEGLGQWTDVAIQQIDGLFGVDLVASNAQPGRVSWFRAPQNAITGTNWQRLDIDAADRTGAAAIVVVDVNRDGNADVISAARDESEASLVWYRHPGGAVDPADVWERRTIGNLPDAARLASGDLNRDGLLDVLALSPSQRRIAWYAQPVDVLTGGWSGVVLTELVSNTPVDLATLDADANGQPDVVVGTANQGTLRWFTPLNDVRTGWIENNLADLELNVGDHIV